ncbi:MlaD family protein [Aldersonia kunmingensis]|uniref:MlaD family protein n=1 Tax=Aldersonia kunmingensis TaxID=408066 RepID=UPI000832D7D7|nr:MlaD family protein [Aldersonia kunmingensis]
MTRIPAWLSGLTLAIVLILGGTYLTMNVLQMDPRSERNHIEVDLPESGGLRAGSDVVYRGANIGTVERVEGIPGGVRARISYDSKYQIPESSEMKVENLSALGEPVFAFLPASTTGPWFGDGAHVNRPVIVPASVPTLLAGQAQLLEQADPVVVARMVDTFQTSLADLDTAIPTIGRGAEMLLATLMRHEPSLDAALRNLMRAMADSDWIEPVLTAAPPQLDAFGVTLGASFKYLFVGSQALKGKEVLGSWHEEEEQLVSYLQRSSPDIGAIGVALRPVTTSVGPLFGLIDFGDLLETALQTLPGDSVRVAVRMPN